MNGWYEEEPEATFLKNMQKGKLYRLKRAYWFYQPGTLSTIKKLKAGSILLYVGIQIGAIEGSFEIFEIVFLFQDRTVALNTMFMEIPFKSFEEIKL